MGGLSVGREAERLIAAGGRRYVIGLRVFTLVPLAAVALAIADDTATRIAVLVALYAVASWSAVYIWRVLHGAVVWPAVVDAFVLAALALATPWIVPADWLATSSTWIRPLIASAAFGYQYSTSWPVGLGLGALVCGVNAVATTVAEPGPAGLDDYISGFWTFSTVLLARLLWTLLVGAGRRADAIFDEVIEARRAQAVAESVRADERAITNALHDTAASTLMWVGLGHVGDEDRLVRTRAERDLRTLRAIWSGGPINPPIDVCEELSRLGDHEAIDVVFVGPERLPVPSDVAHALTGAAAEALANVRRHAGTDFAVIKVTGDPSRPRVEIRDRGRGFDAAAVPSTRRGVRESIRGRMREVGGSAEIDSVPGAGTVVRLVWPDE